LSGGINVAFSSYSLFEAPPIWRWFRKMNLKLFRDIWFPPVVTPHHLNVTVLPLEFRKKAAAQMDLSEMPDLFSLHKILSEPAGWDLQPEEQAKHFRNFIKFTSEVDRMRGT